MDYTIIYQIKEEAVRFMTQNRLHCSALVIKLYQGPEIPYLYLALYYTGAEKIG